MFRTRLKSLREKRHYHIRRKLAGLPERPRLSVYRSLTHIYAQVIDDSTGATLASASTVEKGLQEQLKGKNRTAQAGLVGTTVARRAIEKGLSQVVFDRGGYIYHGRVKALADAARSAGLKF